MKEKLLGAIKQPYRFARKVARRLLDLAKLSVYAGQCGDGLILLDTPTHDNLGDHAIALAELQFLERKSQGKRVCEITATELDGKETVYASRTPVGKTVFVHGGGFLGTLWPQEEERFRRILKAFDKQKIVVFPQTVTFDMTTQGGQEYLRQSQEIYAAHKDLTLYVREERSYIFVKEYFPEVKVFLVPDIVMALSIEMPQSERDGILMCMRADHEKKVSDEEIHFLEKELSRLLPDQRQEYTDTVTDHRVFPKSRYDEVVGKLTQFSKAKLVLTDRLHGMVFAALTGTPCIAMGNSNGKVRGVYRWIQQNKYVRYLENVCCLEDALNQLDLNVCHRYQMEEEAFLHLDEIVRPGE